MGGLVKRCMGGSVKLRRVPSVRQAMWNDDPSTLTDAPTGPPSFPTLSRARMWKKGCVNE